MERRKRLIVASLWIGVAVVMATTLEVGVGVPSSAGGIARLFVVVVALFLASVYLLDPWNVVSDPFRQG